MKLKTLMLEHCRLEYVLWLVIIVGVNSWVSEIVGVNS